MRGKTIKKLSETEKAYIAAILDGEGSVGISRKKDNKGMRAGYAIRPIVSVTNTREDLIHWLVEKTGLGTCIRSKVTNSRHKAAWRWQLWSQQARQLL